MKLELILDNTNCYDHHCVFLNKEHFIVLLYALHQQKIYWNQNMDVSPVWVLNMAAFTHNLFTYCTIVTTTFQLNSHINIDFFAKCKQHWLRSTSCFFFMHMCSVKWNTTWFWTTVYVLQNDLCCHRLHVSECALLLLYIVKWILFCLRRNILYLRSSIIVASYVNRIEVWF